LVTLSFQDVFETVHPHLLNKKVIEENSVKCHWCKLPLVYWCMMGRAYCL